jgi:hypothetical protein
VRRFSAVEMGTRTLELYNTLAAANVGTMVR